MNHQIPPPASQGRLLTVEEVASLLGISVRKTWRMSSTGELPPPVTVGQRGTRFKSDDIENYMQSLSPKASPRATQPQATARNTNGIFEVKHD